jgi:aminoglycoside 3-N-acetyltransferase
MSERDAIELAEEPATVASLTADLRALGLAAGMTVMVHSSLSRLGYVSGGPHAVVLALLDVLGPTGTLVMPTHSADLSDPAGWSRPPVPEAWWDRLRAEMPAYDPLLTPTRAMGAIVECFRHVPGVQRSTHPTVSAAAIGPNAAAVVGNHELADGLGEGSPQARLYDLDASVLLLGVTHANNTSLHLAEHRVTVAAQRWTTWSSPVLVDGRRQWVTVPALVDDDEDFEPLGEAFAATGLEARGPVAAGTGRLCRVRDVVDFAVAWMDANRPRG